VTITLTLDKDDYLIHQLFTTSKSERIKKKRLKSKVILSLIYIVFGILSFFEGKTMLALIFLVIGTLWFFIYPLWESRHYIKHYQALINENYKDRFGKPATLFIDNDIITTKDHGSESSILTSELTEINEIPLAIFMRVKGGQSLILPKQKITDLVEVRTRLMELAAHLKIEYNLDESWAWK
jgi:hypothetical protein